MQFDLYNTVPLPVFIVDARNGKVLSANDLARKQGIHLTNGFFEMLEDKALFSQLVKERNKPVRKKTVLIIDSVYYHAVFDINDIEADGQAALLILISELEPMAQLSEQGIVDQICEAYIKNEKNPLYDFLRITAQSAGAFCAALYEKKNGRYTIRDEWRERKCVCVPMLSPEFEGNYADEIARLKSLKRAEDVMYLPYKKEYGTHGVIMYFSERKIQDAFKDRISKYIDLYKALAPDTPENTLGAMKTGLELVEQGIAIWDAATKELLYQNKAFRERFGSGSAQLLINRLPKDFKPGTGPNLVFTDSAGRSYSMSHRKSRFGSRKLITTIVCNITRYKKAENRLEALARTDALTGLDNRRAGLEILESVYQQCKKDGKPLTVCFADIDGLKKINDTYGHGVGDNMIRTVAGILKKQIDGAGHVCRLGGDEFVLIMPGYRKAQAVMLTSKIEKAVDRYFINGFESISVSFGFKEADYSPGETSSTLLRIADQDMYREKKSKPSV